MHLRLFAFSVLIIDQAHGRMLYVYVYIQCVDHSSDSQEDAMCVCMLTVC